MLYETIELRVTDLGVSVPLTMYVPDNSPEIEPDRKRPAVIVCPGGGYEFRSDREAEPIALRFLALGFNAFVLNYHVAPARFPIPQAELATAVAYLRENAGMLRTDPRRIFVAGFSAGGHLAASLGVMHNGAPFTGMAELSRRPIRPDGLILCYPVISADYMHEGTFRNLLGERFEIESERQAVSLEKRVTPSTPPSFLWHTFEDEDVPVENSLVFAEALARARVSTELHIFPQGEHGLSLSNDQVYGPRGASSIRPECACWIDFAARWIRSFR